MTGLYQEVVHAAELPQAKLNEIFVAASSPPRNRNLATAGLLFGGILMITSAFNAHPAPAQTLLGAAGVAGGIAYGARQDQKRLAARREILSILAVKHPGEFAPP